MAILGTIVIEDKTIQFNVVSDSAQVMYTVVDSMTGEAESRVVEADPFLMALSIALNINGELPGATPDNYAMAEAVQPKSETLRFIP